MHRWRRLVLQVFVAVAKMLWVNLSLHIAGAGSTRKLSGAQQECTHPPALAVRRGNPHGSGLYCGHCGTRLSWTPKAKAKTTLPLPSGPPTKPMMPLPSAAMREDHQPDVHSSAQASNVPMQPMPHDAKWFLRPPPKAKTAARIPERRSPIHAAASCNGTSGTPSSSTTWGYAAWWTEEEVWQEHTCAWHQGHPRQAGGYNSQNERAGENGQQSAEPVEEEQEVGDILVPEQEVTDVADAAADAEHEALF